MPLHQGKYRVESARLKGWDYSQPGWYYVTLCTQDRQCHFGDIANDQMRPSAIGEIVAEEWQRTPVVRPNVGLDAWILMPNHLHGIIILQEAKLPRPLDAGAVPPHLARGELKPGSIGAIMGQIKSVCKKRIRAAGFPEFDWQPRFYDHIVRDDRSLANIRQYIVNNPAQWALDELNADRL